MGETSLMGSTPKGSCPSGNKKLSLSKHLPADPAQRMLAAGWAALRSMGPMGAPRASLQQLRGLRGGQLNSGRVQIKESQVTPGQTIVLEEASLVKETQDRINNSLVSDPGRLFAVLHIRGHQHKVTAGDLVMVLADLGAPMGSKIVINKLLALGSKDFTLLGRPVLPRDLAMVEATVIEKTLSRTKIVQQFKRRMRARHIKFSRQKWTLLRINSITVTGRVGETMDR